MTDVILVVNAGSSSIKFAIYPATPVVTHPSTNAATMSQPEALISGKIAGIGSKPVFLIRDAQQRGLHDDGLHEIDSSETHAGLTARLLDWIADHTAGYHLTAAGHRVVHGGRTFDAPVLIQPDIMATLADLTSLAPLHQPNNLAVIRAIRERQPGLPQVACFDTSFHRTQPRLAQLFALPRSMSDAGIIRYGFHGLSYEYISSVLPSILGSAAEGRVIVAHLGNGSSLCAMKHRRSVASTMGFTALDGLMMGRRCGTLDAGVVLHMMDQMGMSSAEVSQLLYRESGLLGVSGLSNDMQILEASSDPAAREAIELYCYRAATQFAALACTLEGLDAIVFTAGIGENSVTVRRLICERLAWLGVRLNSAANSANAPVISDDTSTIRVVVMPTNEEAVIAAAVNVAIR